MFDTSWLKVITFFGIWAIFWLPIALMVSRSIDWQVGQSLTSQQKLSLLGSLYLLSPIILLGKIRAENLSLPSLGLSLHPNLLLSILLGIAISVVGVIVIILIQSLFNLVSWHRENIPQLFSSLLPILLLGLLISTVEETVFRGYIFTTFAQDYSLWWAATFSSFIFALLHLIWERKQTLPQIPGLWLMGMVLTVARVIDDGSLGLAIGLHTGWIWSYTCIDSANIVTYNQQTWLTGFNGQPLAGVFGVLGLMITGLILWFGANSNFLLFV